MSEIFGGSFDLLPLINFCTVPNLVKICKPSSSSSNLFVSKVLPLF